MAHRAQRFRWDKDRNTLVLVDVNSQGREVLRQCVAGERAKRALLKEYHDTPCAGHQGFERTYAAIADNYFWPRLRRAVTRYIKTCNSCQRSKADPTAATAPLHPIETPTSPGEVLSLDFVEVPMSLRGHDYIMVVVDKFSKLLRIAATTKKVDAQGAAELFLQLTLPTFARLPTTLISDRDPRFTAELWQQLWTSVGTTLKMTTAHRPQADGQTERANRVVLEYLRHYVNAAGSDWDAPVRLAQLEFALNSKLSSASQTTPYELHLGRPAVPPAALGAPSVKPGEAEPIHSVWRRAREAMQEAEDQMVKTAGGRVRATPRFKVGDKVLLHTRNYEQYRTHKLAYPYIGPFTGKKVPSATTVVLDIDQSWYNIHPTINIEAIKPYDDARDQQPPPQKYDAQGQPVFDMERIIAERKHYKTKQYLVRWEGYGPEYDTWEPEYKVRKCKEIWQAYQATLPGKRPTRRSQRREGE